MSTQAILVTVVAVLAVFYMLYARLIKTRNKVQESMSDVDVQLKKRYDLIPNMLIIDDRVGRIEKSCYAEHVCCFSERKNGIGKSA